MSGHLHPPALDCVAAREAVSARLDGELVPSEEPALVAHLEHCAGCRSFAAGADALHRTTRVRPAEPVPDHTDAVREAWERQRSGLGGTLSTAERPTRRRLGARVGAGVLVAAAIVLLAGVAGWWPTSDGPSAAPEVRFAAGYATPAPEGGATAIYLSLTNDGGADQLVGVESVDAERASLHRTEQEDGYVVMADQVAYPVPAEGSVVFQPGGAHVMLEGLTREVEVGDELALTLRFERSPERRVVAEVVGLSEVVEVVGLAPGVVGEAS
jgi:copper(I)-binding protein